MPPSGWRSATPAVARRRRGFAAKVNYVLRGVGLGGECLCKVLVVLASDAALSFAVQVQVGSGDFQ